MLLERPGPRRVGRNRRAKRTWRDRQRRGTEANRPRSDSAARGRAIADLHPDPSVHIASHAFSNEHRAGRSLGGGRVDRPKHRRRNRIGSRVPGTSGAPKRASADTPMGKTRRAAGLSRAAPEPHSRTTCFPDRRGRQGYGPAVPSSVGRAEVSSAQSGKPSRLRFGATARRARLEAPSQRLPARSGTRPLTSPSHGKRQRMGSPGQVRRLYLSRGWS